MIACVSTVVTIIAVNSVRLNEVTLDCKKQRNVWVLCDKVGVDDLFESSEIEGEEWLYIQVCLSVKVKYGF